MYDMLIEPVGAFRRNAQRSVAENAGVSARHPYTFLIV